MSINCVSTHDLNDFINDVFSKSGRNTAILGVSGGLDSAVVATFLLHASKVKNIKLIHFTDLEIDKNQEVKNPDNQDLYFIRSKKIFDRVKELYHGLIEHNHLAEKNIELIFEKKNFICPFHYSTETKENLKVMTNCESRSMMIKLYAYAEEYNGLVVGTTNLSEYFTGYYTKWGDGAADLEPIIGILKTKVKEIGKLYGIPMSILNAVPSADLYIGQTDEKEMGVTYKEIDEVIQYIANLTECDDKSDIVKQITKEVPEKYNEVLKIFYKNLHKMESNHFLGPDVSKMLNVLKS